MKTDSINYSGYEILMILMGSINIGFSLNLISRSRVQEANDVSRVC